MATTKLPPIVGQSLYFEKPVEVILSNGDFLFIPAGYITDFGTIPRLLWAFIIPIGRHNLATLIHDFMLTDTSYSRKQADQEFLYWLKVSEVSWLKRSMMYAAVRLYAMCSSYRTD